MLPAVVVSLLFILTVAGMLNLFNYFRYCNCLFFLMWLWKLRLETLLESGEGSCFSWYFIWTEGGAGCSRHGVGGGEELGRGLDSCGSPGGLT